MKSLRQSSEGSRSSYDLTVPPVVRFGHGRIAEAGHIAAILGKRIWLVVGKHSFAVSGGRETLLDGFHQNGLIIGPQMTRDLTKMIPQKALGIP